MKKWFLIENCGGDIFETALTAESQDAAIKEATDIWTSLSQHDRRRRTSAVIIHADVDDLGCVDYESADESADIMGN